MPIDLHARRRLRDAQRSEAAAVSAVLKARQHQDTVSARMRAVMAKHEASLDDATHQVQAAQAELVKVSGLDRAATLLNVPRSELKAATRAATINGKDQTAENS